MKYFMGLILLFGVGLAYAAPPPMPIADAPAKPVAVAPAEPAITLDAPKSVVAGSGYFKVKAISPGPVAYDVEAQFEDPDAVFKSEQLDTTTLLVAVPASAGVIRITAAASVAGGPPIFAKAFIEVTAAKTPSPPVPPAPTGPAPVKVGKLFAIFVVDIATAPGPVAGDPKLAEALKAGGDERSVISTVSKSVESQGLTKFVADAGGAPALILMDEKGNVHQAVRLPATAAEVVALVATVHKGK